MVESLELPGPPRGADRDPGVRPIDERLTATARNSLRSNGSPVTVVITEWRSGCDQRAAVRTSSNDFRQWIEAQHFEDKERHHGLASANRARAEPAAMGDTSAYPGPSVEYQSQYMRDRKIEQICEPHAMLRVAELDRTAALREKRPLVARVGVS